MKLRQLRADDELIRKEGISSLTDSELQLACRERGMRALGLTTDTLRIRLAQWCEAESAAWCGVLF
jgi:LETM1 and EF-hand domain-containing protein 1